MTALISIATKDSIVIGCDSLATVSQPMIEPKKLRSNFFDKNGDMLKDEKGEPLLKRADQLNAFARRVPKTQLPNVTKIYNLKPLVAGALFAGIAGIGEKTIRNLVEAFTSSQEFEHLVKSEYTIKDVAETLKAYLEKEYDAAFEGNEKSYRPYMEILLSGYSKGSWKPEVFRISMQEKGIVNDELAEVEYDVVLGGQKDIIERVVFGVDTNSFNSLKDRSEEILKTYREAVISKLKSAGIEADIPDVDFTDKSYDLFGKNFGGVKGTFNEIAGLSEQAAVDFAEFLISTMIKGQQFSGIIPTVGGAIHMAIITKQNGFKWISKEEYSFQGVTIPKYEE